MKKFLALLLVTAVLFSGCSSQYHTDVTREEIVAAYETAGYNVWTNTYENKLETGAIAYVQANHPDGDYIYFTFFESEEDAKAYEIELDHPVMKGLFSVIFGDPSWERLETYGCIVVSYTNPDFFDPFEELLTQN
jgi:hypothetical protein